MLKNAIGALYNSIKDSHFPWGSVASSSGIVISNKFIKPDASLVMINAEWRDDAIFTAALFSSVFCFLIKNFLAYEPSNILLQKSKLLIYLFILFLIFSCIIESYLSFNPSIELTPILKHVWMYTFILAFISLSCIATLAVMYRKSIKSQPK